MQTPDLAIPAFLIRPADQAPRRRLIVTAAPERRIINAKGGTTYSRLAAHADVAAYLLASLRAGWIDEAELCAPLDWDGDKLRRELREIARTHNVTVARQTCTEETTRQRGKQRGTVVEIRRTQYRIEASA